MKDFSWSVICASVVLLATSARCEVASSQDSYLNALQTSHQNNNAADRGDYDYAYHHDFNEGGSGYDYQPSGPSPQYGPPVNGLPSSYGPPSHGPPSYGPPSFEHPVKPVYGPPPHHPPIHHPPPFFHYEHPRETWLLDKFKFKIDLFTIGKVLLKLILFKKVIKFIALICLLLFLPKLKNLVKDDEEDMGSSEGRKLVTDKDKLNERINEVTNFALTAFDTFSRKYEGCEREQIWCRFQRMFDTVDAKYPYEKIVKLYLPDSEVTTNKLAIDH